MSNTDTAILAGVLSLIGTLILGLFKLLGKRGDQAAAADSNITEQEKQMRAELRLDIASARAERDALRAANDKLEAQNELLEKQVSELQQQNGLLRTQANDLQNQHLRDLAVVEVLQERVGRLERIIDDYRHPKGTSGADTQGMG